MAANKRTPMQVAADRLEITWRYLRRETQASIALVLGLTQQQISFDLKAIRAQWHREMVLAIDEAKLKELAAIDRLELEYWQAWERSRRTRKKLASRRSSNLKNALAISEETQRRDGNPAFLAGVMSCIDKRCKVLGLDAPQKLAPTDPSGEREYGSLSDSELLRRVNGLLEAARARAARETDPGN